MKGWKTINTNDLNVKTKWVNAARLACVLAVGCGKVGDIVPMFSPNTGAAPSSRLIRPLAHMGGMVTAEACTIMVNIADEQEQE